MTLLTCFELKYNYPNDILVNSDINTNGKYAAWCYRLKDGEIHKPLLSTDYTFDTAEDATNEMHKIIVECIESLAN